jgi:hypothetical protein
MDIDFIINDITNYNKEQQISTLIELCKNNSNTQLCSYVVQNKYDNWFNYLSENNNQRLFSKGMDRLQTWVKLLQDEPQLYFSKKIVPENSEQQIILQKIIHKLKSKYKFFILAGLIVIFQVFGDGNHRTAKYFYKLTTGENIYLNQEKKINNLLRNNDYYTISKNPIIQLNSIISELINIASNTHGGKKRKTRKTIRRIKKSKKMTF